MAYTSTFSGSHHNQHLSPQSYSKVWLLFFISQSSPSLSHEACIAWEAPALGTALSAVETVIRGGL